MHTCLKYKYGLNLLRQADLKQIIPAAGKKWTAKDCTPPPMYEGIDVIKDRTRLLPVLPKVPQNAAPLKHIRREWMCIRGPCLGEDAELKLNQYAIIALKGAFLKAGHIDMLRLTINRGMRLRPYLFAQFRIPPVHKPVTRHPKNAVMGGGKGKIDHYVTPVKARQVIVEVGGKASFEEVYQFLKIAAQNLPMPAVAVTHERLKMMYEEERRIEDENQNFITFREIAEKNMQGMRSYLTKYDLKHYGIYK